MLLQDSFEKSFSMESAGYNQIITTFISALFLTSTDLDVSPYNYLCTDTFLNTLFEDKQVLLESVFYAQHLRLGSNFARSQDKISSEVSIIYNENFFYFCQSMKETSFTSVNPWRKLFISLLIHEGNFFYFCQSMEETFHISVNP